MKVIGNVSDWLSYAGGALIKVADSAGSTVYAYITLPFFAYITQILGIFVLQSKPCQAPHTPRVKGVLKCLQMTRAYCVLYSADSLYIPISCFPGLYVSDNNIFFIRLKQFTVNLSNNRPGNVTKANEPLHEKPTIWIYDKVPHGPACTVTEAG